MILNALDNYYDRMAAASDSGMPSYGTSVENISFALVIAQDGSLREVEDLREQSGNKLRPRKMLVPAAEKKASGIKPNFLWDTTSYVLGMDDKGNPERTDRCRLAFLDHTQNQCDGSDIGLKAVIAFLEANNGRTVSLRDDWQDICGTNIVFRLDGTPGFMHERPAARTAWKKHMGQRGEKILGQCLISGEAQQPLARLHPSIKGVRGAQSSGASIVSFNHNAFVSYGKQQSLNAPVGQQAAFAYTAALNFLLSRGSRQKIIIADTTYIFWAKRPTPAEALFADLFAPSAGTGKAAADQDDQQTAHLIRGLLKAVRDGRRPADFLPDLDEDVQFYILGLAPNAARLSIRFWEADSLGALLRRVGRHYEQLSIVRQFDSEPEFPPLWRLLVQTATLGKTENISPVLAGGLTRAMLTGAQYPQSLLPVVLSRIRAEHDVTYYRAALLKAYLMRNKDMKEVPVSLDPDRTDLPYLLGRLFSVLEKAQEDAIPNANATVKDRYLSSASATPGQVFHMLIKNSAHHIAKLKRDPKKKGIAIRHEKRIQNIINGFSDYPKTLKPEEQGLFMIGYYHQRKDFYTQKTQEGKDGHNRQSL